MRFVFVYIHHTTHQLISSFPHLKVILTTLETPKNIFSFNNNMNDNSKQLRPPGQEQVWLYRPGYAGTTTNLQIVLNTPQKSQLKSSPPPPQKKTLAKFSYPKKSRNRKFQTQKMLRSSPSLEIRSTAWGCICQLIPCICLHRVDSTTSPSL